MTDAYVGLGSNRGDRRAALEGALRALAALPGTRVDAVSSIYETDAVGLPGDAPYLNAVARLVTAIEPEPILDAFLAIERGAGRVDAARFGPRVLDLDLLAWGDRAVVTPRLTLPHPRLAARPFVLVPLAEIAPDWRHPVLGATAAAMLGGFGFVTGVRPVGRLAVPGAAPAAVEESSRS